MKALKLFLGLVFLLALCIAGCVKPPELPNTPRIVSVDLNTVNFPGVFTPETINDSLFILIEFEDGDADLGEREDEPVPYITIEDSRTGEIQTFGMNGIEVNGALGSIQGTIQVKHKTCCSNANGIVCFPEDNLPPSEEVQFIVQLVDRAGNVSNSVTSPVLTLDCFP